MLTIGTVTALKRPQNYKVSPDNRKVRLETDIGIVIQDHGTFGNTITCNADFDAAGFSILKGYADTGTLVSVTDYAGTTYTNCTVIIDDFTLIDKFEPRRTCSLTIWN